MPRTFQLPTSDTRFWRPLSDAARCGRRRKSIRDSDSIEVLGRLAPGVRFEDARAEMAVIAARLREAHAVNSNVDVRIIPLFDHVVGSRTRRGMWLGFAAVLCLLVIACANVGGLLSARAARRRRELAVRSALGAGRARLVRQLLAESVSLWAVASVAGVLLASALDPSAARCTDRGRFPEWRRSASTPRRLRVAFLGGLAVVMVARHHARARRREDRFGGGVWHSRPVEPAAPSPAGSPGRRADRRSADAPRRRRALRAELRPRAG